MIAIVTLLIVLVVSLIVVRVATVALTLTGLSRELARFQARSAFTGAGFTTSESELLVRHPVRRRIIMLLMLLGNAGIVTAVSSLILSFVTVDQAAGWTGTLGLRLAVLLVGLAALWIAASSRWIDRWMSLLIGKALRKWTTVELRDYAGLLHLTGDYVVVELAVEEGDWLADRFLHELRLSDEGVLVLGVEEPGGVYNGAPRGQTRLQVGDTLLLYGRQDILHNLDERRAGREGNWEHYTAVERQQRREAEEASALKGQQTAPKKPAPPSDDRERTTLETE